MFEPGDDVRTRCLAEQGESNTVRDVSKRRLSLIGAAVIATVLAAGSLFATSVKSEIVPSTEASASVVSRQVNSCAQSGPEVVDCIKDVFDEAATSVSPSYALTMLAAVSPLTSNLLGQCHAVAHAMGRTYFDKFGAPAYDTPMDSCGFGYSHGLLESAAHRVETADLKSIIVQVCGKILGERLSSCTHGLGHALYLEEASPTTAVALCNEIPEWFGRTDATESWRIARDCMNGWPMEQQAQSPELRNTAESLASVTSICDKLPGPAGLGCVYALGRNYVSAFELDETSQVSRLKEFRELCATQEKGLPFDTCRSVLGDAASSLYRYTGDSAIVAKGLQDTCGTGFDENDFCARFFIEYQYDAVAAPESYVATACDDLTGSEQRACRTLVTQHASQRNPSAPKD